MNISKYLRSISPELKSWINSLAMKSKDPTHMTTMNCVAAYPIPEDKVSTYF